MNANLWERFIDQFGTTADVGLRVTNLMLAAAALLVAYALTRALRPLQAKLLRSTRPRAWRLVRLLPLLTLLIWILALVLALALAFRPTEHHAVLTWFLVGLALLVGLRDILRETLAGAFVMLQGRVRPGEHIRVGGSRGRVERIGLQRVVLRGPDGEKESVPASIFITSTVVQEDSPGALPVRLDLRIPPEVDPQVGAAVAYEVAAMSPYADPRVRPAVSIELDPEGPRLIVRGRAASPGHANRYRTQVGVRIYRELGALSAKVPAASP